VSGLIGMMIGFSRQAVLSLALGLLVVAPFLFGRGHVMRLVKFAGVSLVLTTVALVAILATPPGRQFWYAFAGRTAQLFDPQAYRSGTAASRADIWTSMVTDIERNPFVGQGQDSYLRYMDPWEQGAHNFPVEVMHSTGLIGFLGYLVLQMLAPLVGFAILIVRPIADRGRLPLIATLAGYISIVAASITNIIYWNPTYWLWLGMMVAAVRIADRTPSRHAVSAAVVSAV